MISLPLVMAPRLDMFNRLGNLQCIKELHQYTKQLIDRQTATLNFQELNQLLNHKIELEKQMVSSQERVKPKGRGGNNIAQNVKKSFLSIIKKRLSTTIIHELKLRFIQPYHLKSQKQNIVLFFMFFQILKGQGKVTQEEIKKVIEELKNKIEKYISNSERRLEGQEGRRQFHEKNIREFIKFRELDLDFSKKRSFRQLGEQISMFYIKKKMDYLKAEKKILKIISSHPELPLMFEGLPKKMNSEESSPLNFQLQLVGEPDLSVASEV